MRYERLKSKILSLTPRPVNKLKAPKPKLV
jgi:hypothetical protein